MYHKKVPMAERENALLSMQQQSGGIMVCTDAAARGIDIQDVTHVVQVCDVEMLSLRLLVDMQE